MSAAPRAELPPSSDSLPRYCGESGCYEEATADGKCAKHATGKTKGRPPKQPAIAAPPPKNDKEVRAEVEALIIPICAFLGTFVDETWEPGVVIDTQQGKGVLIKDNVNKGIDSMVPWFKIYGGAFAKAAPWFGLVGGCIAIAYPAIEPTLEIVAGARKPRYARKSKDDIYTMAYLRYQAEEAKKHNAKVIPIEGEGKSGAPSID